MLLFLNPCPAEQIKMPIRLFNPGCWYKFTYLMANSADPDQLASSEANWSGSTLFAKTGHIWVSRTRVKILGGMSNSVDADQIAVRSSCTVAYAILSETGVQNFRMYTLPIIKVEQVHLATGWCIYMYKCWMSVKPGGPWSNSTFCNV